MTFDAQESTWMMDAFAILTACCDLELTFDLLPPE